MSALGAHRSRLSTVLRWRPEWPFAVFVAFAWVALAAIPGVHGEISGVVAVTKDGSSASGVPSDPAAHELAAHDHERHGSESGAATPTAGAKLRSGGILGALGGWTLMTVGMMVPVTLPAVRHVGLNSLRSRRWRAMTLYLAVYIGVWVMFGIVALIGERIAREITGLDSRVLLAFALTMAAIWQLTRTKRRALFACRRTVPLPPVGRRADAGCARFALLQGWRCVVSCWALMLIMLMVGHTGLIWMVVLTALILVEELTRVGRRLLRPSAAALAFVGGLVVLGI